MNSFGSSDLEIDPDVEEAWCVEIDRRVAELDSGTAETVPWETLQAKLLRLTEVSATD